MNIRSKNLVTVETLCNMTLGCKKHGKSAKVNEQLNIPTSNLQIAELVCNIKLVYLVI